MKITLSTTGAIMNVIFVEPRETTDGLMLIIRNTKIILN